MPPPVDTVTVHRPERGRKGRPVHLCQAGSTCCTCCCCLHTVGGIVFSALKSGTPPPRGGTADDFDLRKPDPSAGRVYWTWFGIMAALCVVAGPVGWVVGALLGPGLQLIASLGAFFVILANDGWGSPRFRSLGRITGWGVLGCIVGILAMIAIGVILSNR